MTTIIIAVCDLGIAGICSHAAPGKLVEFASYAAVGLRCNNTLSIGSIRFGSPAFQGRNAASSSRMHVQ